MNQEFKIPTPEGIKLEKLKSFIVDNYPIQESSHDIEDLFNSAVDGFEVVQKLDKNNEIEGVITYKIEYDENEKCNYCTIGVAVTREESRGEGTSKELFEDLDEICEQKDCEYQAAIADTEDGEIVLEKMGFELFKDPVNGREYYRRDL